jgi:DUF1365 family protein
MNSCFYECDVFHRRLRPKQHEFLYRVFYFYLDLGELDEAARKLKIFGVNRPNLYSLHDKDLLQYLVGALPGIKRLKEVVGRKDRALISQLRNGFREGYGLMRKKNELRLLGEGAADHRKEGGGSLKV